MYQDNRDLKAFSAALKKMQTYLTKNTAEFDSPLITRAFHLFSSIAHAYYRPSANKELTDEACKNNNSKSKSKLNDHNRPTYVRVDIGPKDCQQFPIWSTYREAGHYRFSLNLEVPGYRCGKHHVIFASGYDDDGFASMFVQDIAADGKQSNIIFRASVIARHLIEYAIIARIYLARQYAAQKAQAHRKVRRHADHLRDKSRSFHRHYRAIANGPYSLTKLFGHRTLANISRANGHHSLASLLKKNM